MNKSTYSPAIKAAMVNFIMHCKLKLKGTIDFYIFLLIKR